MNPYRPPLSDMRFQLQTFGYDDLVSKVAAFADYDLDTAMDLIEAYGAFCVDALLPLNGVGDQQGVKWDPETKDVKMPDGFAEAYAAYCENGFASMPFDPEYGGLGAPFTLSTVAGEIIAACNKSFSMCPGLTAGLIEALEAHGSDEQKAKYLPKLISGEWTGTMCLTEPQCGTDLGLLTTRAEPFGDHYKLTGVKTWITFGEHSMSENIIHLVLARLPDAPAGIKGISTFVVNLEGAEGYLFGQPHKGMRSMFIMMNAARLQVGAEGVSLGEASYQSALAFAKDRRQSRSLDPSKRDEDHAADNILVHPDVRRMLLEVKSTTEALRALVTWIAIQYDTAHHTDDDEAKQKANDLVALMTPIIKSYGSERGFENISTAMQVMGGAGFTADWPVEQYMRDERIALIYEGTNHIQALDLVGRKLPMHGGRLMQTFAGEVTAVIRAGAASPELAPFVASLKEESKRLNATTMAMGAEAMKDAEVAGAVASNYLNQFAMVVLGYVWIRQLQQALTLPEDDKLRRSKFQLAKYYFDMVMPNAAMFAAKVAAGKAPVDIDVDLL
jgi:alkylation response protein AidB-like acyl-CoA dehydrogenase